MVFGSLFLLFHSQTSVLVLLGRWVTSLWPSPSSLHVLSHHPMRPTARLSIHWWHPNLYFQPETRWFIHPALCSTSWQSAKRHLYRNTSKTKSLILHPKHALTAILPSQLTVSPSFWLLMSVDSVGSTFRVYPDLESLLPPLPHYSGMSLSHHLDCQQNPPASSPASTPAPCRMATAEEPEWSCEYVSETVSLLYSEPPAVPVTPTVNPKSSQWPHGLLIWFPATFLISFLPVSPQLTAL